MKKRPSFLKRSADRTGQLVVKDLLHQSVGGSEPARSQQVIHASDLTKEDPEYCPREVYIRQAEGKKRPPQFLPVATQVTFNEGNDKQWRLNNDWLVDIMVGDWVCLACDESREFCKRPDHLKSSTHDHVWEYREPHVLDRVSKSSGSLDAIIDVGSGKLRVIECKIMKSENFKELKAPLSEHRVRTRLYLRQLAGSSEPFAKEIETDFAHILYIMRGHGYKQDDGRISPFKEFIVRREDSDVNHYIGMAHALTLSRSAPGAMCAAGICKTQMDPRAKKCPVAQSCFSGKYESNLSWYRDGAPVHTGDNIDYVTDGEELHECRGE